MQFEDFDSLRLEDWKEEHPDIFEEYKEDLFSLVLATSADQLEHLAERLDEMSSEIREEVNHIDNSLNGGENP